MLPMQVFAVDINRGFYKYGLMKGKKLLKNIHPGEILLEEFLKPLGISQYQLAKEANISQASIKRIIKAEQSITPAIALKLASYFKVSGKLWLGLQADYDIEELKRNLSF